MALTGSKKRFAEAILAGKTNKEAAIAAGLSAKTASAAGTRMSKDKDVVAYLAKMRKPAEFPVAGAPKDQNWPFGTEPASPTPPAPDVPAADPPKVLTGEDYLREVVNDREQDPKLRLDAAKKLIEFEKSKPAPMGKKEAKNEEAKKQSRFAAAAPPKLVAAGGKKV